MGIVRIFNLLSVCVFYTNFYPSEVLSDEMCFLFSIAQFILRDGSTPSLDVVLIWCLWLCLSLLHPSTHQAVILCPDNAFQQPFRGSHVRVLRLHVSPWICSRFSWFWRGPTQPCCLQPTLLALFHFLFEVMLIQAWLYICDNMRNTGITGMFVPTGGALFHFVSPSWHHVLHSVEADWEVPKPSPLHAAPAVVLLLM